MADRLLTIVKMKLVRHVGQKYETSGNYTRDGGDEDEYEDDGVSWDAR